MATQHVEQPTMRAERQQIRTQPNWTFVDAYEFQTLAVSARRLLRADEPAAGLRGLLDPETGTHFVTEEEKLFALKKRRPSRKKVAAVCKHCGWPQHPPEPA